MDDIPEPGTHAAKHGRNDDKVEVDGSRAMFRFNPSAMEAMQELHALALLHGKDNFPVEAAQNLRDMAYGKPITVDGAMAELVLVASVAGECYAKTGDKRVYEALYDLGMALRGMDGNAIPTAVTVKSAGKGKGRA